MTAVDTNLLVRLLTADDPEQEAAARSIFEAQSIWIAKTVLLETGWVLQRLYGFDEASVVVAFTKLLGLENVQAEDSPAVIAALRLAECGIEFADALHMQSKPPGAAFVSFDKALVKRAQRAGVADVLLLPVSSTAQ